MVQALTHGNEYCGAMALDGLLRELGAGTLSLQAGRLILAFANVEAYARFDFADPVRSRFIDEDYNRVWADEVLFGPRDSAELRRARQLQPFVDAADCLLDIHSMHEPCRPIMVCGMADKHLELARRIGLPADLMMDLGHPAGLRMRRSRQLQRPGQPAPGAAGRVRPALGSRVGRRRTRHDAALPRRDRQRRAGRDRAAPERAAAANASASCASPRRWSRAAWTSASWCRSTGSA